MKEMERLETNRIVDIFCQMSEKDFTIDILLPLFESLNYAKGDYNGGGNEIGKDIIMWSSNPIGDIELTVVQVKKMKMSARIASSKSFAEIVTQLSQCISEEVIHIDGNNYVPNSVFFITPYQIDTRQLLTFFRGYKTLKHEGLSILDGPRIIELLKNNNPNLFNSIIGSTESINVALLKKINNNALMCALESKQCKNIGDIYCDVDFLVGAYNTEELLSSSIVGTSHKDSFSYEKWKHICEIDKKLSNLTSKSIITSNFKHIENSFRSERVKYKNALEKKENLLDEIKIYQNNMIDIVSAFEKLLPNFKGKKSEKHEEENTKSELSQYLNGMKSLLEFPEKEIDPKYEKKEKDKLF